MSMRRADPTNPAHWMHVDPSRPQRLARRLFTRPGRIWLRYRAFGHEPRVPPHGGFLLAPAPHGAFTDPLVFMLGQPRVRLRFMAKEQALAWPIVGRIIRWGGGFPVQRGSGRSGTALDMAQAVLKSGDGVVIFMEGKLVLDHDGLGTPRSGVARLALATGVPVVPVAAYGTKRAEAYGKRWWQYRRTATVVWGEPIRFEQDSDPTPERVDEVRELIWVRITDCFARARVHAVELGRASLDQVGLTDG